MSTAEHLLIVDDERDFRESLSMLLDLEGFQVSEAANGHEALAALDRGLQPDLLLIDQRMPGLTGSQTLQALRARGLCLPAILVSAASDGAEIATRMSFQSFVPKPFDPEMLLERIRTALAGSGRR